MTFRRRENSSLAAQNMPPEFKFQPTRMYYSAPPRNIIYEDAMGSNGQAPLDPTSERMLDPIHWQSGRSPIDNMKATTQGVISRLTHHLRHERSSKPTIVRKLHRGTVRTHTDEAPGARAPRVKGRTPLEISRGAKLMKTLDPGPELDKVLQITASKRGFTPGSRRSYAALLARGRAEVVENLATQLEYSDQKRNAPRVRVGGSELTRSQLAKMPPGYVKEIMRRRARRDAQQIKPRVRFDPRESKGLSPHGQVTTMFRPGLVPVGDGLYAHPGSVGRGVYTDAILPTDFLSPGGGGTTFNITGKPPTPPPPPGQVTAFGALGQASNTGAKGMVGIALVLLGGLTGMALLLSAGK